MDSSREQGFRGYLAEMLSWRRARQPFERALADIPADLRGVQPSGIPHSLWQLLEHLRRAQRDILNFCREPENYQDHVFPDDYWPATAAPPSDEAWEESIRAFRADVQAMQDLINDPATDVLASIPYHRPGTYTALQQVLILADHNAYHIGQIVTVRQLLGIWPPEEGA